MFPSAYVSLLLVSLSYVGFRPVPSTSRQKQSKSPAENAIMCSEPDDARRLFSGGMAEARSFLLPLEDLAAATANSAASPPTLPAPPAAVRQSATVFDAPFLDVLSDEIVQPPTMHPNLVSTLKSIISSQPTSSCNSNNMSDLATDILDSTTTYSFQDLQQSLFAPSPVGASMATSVASMATPAPSPAAIVPVDLIQNRRPFQCSFPGCHKTFKNPQTLKMHRKTHYSQDSSFRKGAHSLATFPPSSKAGHNKKIPSKCPICTRTFVGLYELRRHFGRKHSEGEKSHGCRKCGKKFYIEVDLRDHEKLCGEPLECKCGMKFAFKCNLVAHKKTHPDCQDSCEDQASVSVASATPTSREQGGDQRSFNGIHNKPRETDLQAPASLHMLPFTSPPATCALGANFPIHNTFVIPFPKESSSMPSNLTLNPDIKSEDIAFPWFTSATFGVRPMV